MIGGKTKMSSNFFLKDERVIFLLSQEHIMSLREYALQKN